MNYKCEPHFSFKRIKHAMNGPPPIGAGVKGDGGATRILHKRGEGTGESVQVEATTEHYLDGTR